MSGLEEQRKKKSSSVASYHPALLNFPPRITLYLGVYLTLNCSIPQSLTTNNSAGKNISLVLPHVLIPTHSLLFAMIRPLFLSILQSTQRPNPQEISSLHALLLLNQHNLSTITLLGHFFND